ncbi:MAG: DNA polymerase, partial [Methanomicrobiales archaeon]|nr:DNA polymerase [Methanomicrobiales archaeon]
MALFGGITIPDHPDPENIRRLDVLPLPMISQMTRYGMRIDPEHFAELSSRLGTRMGDLRADIVNEIPPDKLDRFVELSTEDEEDIDVVVGTSDVYAGSESRFDLSVDSSEQVGRLLYDVLGIHLDSTVQIKKTRGGRLSTGKKTLEQFKREYPVVRLILEYRECAKLKGTYADSMPRRARR